MSSNLIYPTIKIQGLTVTIVSLACQSMLFEIAWFVLQPMNIWKLSSIKVPSALHQSNVYWFIGRMTCCIHSCHQVIFKFTVPHKLIFSHVMATFSSLCSHAYFESWRWALADIELLFMLWWVFLDYDGIILGHLRWYYIHLWPCIEHMWLQIL